MNDMNQTPNFTVQPETRAITITKDHTTDIRFLATSRSALRGEAHIIPLAVKGNRTAAKAAQFAPWLTIIGDRELDFDAAGEAKSFTVRITIPDNADPGEYLFRLKVVDVAEPDETVGESPEIAFQVVGPKPSLAGFVMAAALALLMLAALAVWAVILVQNQTNLQLNIRALSSETVRAGDQVSYEVTVENRRVSAVNGVRLRYDLPDGVIGAYASVVGAISRRCDKINRARTIICDLGALASDEQTTIQFALLSDPNGPASATEDEEILAGDTGFLAWLRSFFTTTATTVQRNQAGQITNTFRLSGNQIATRTESETFAVKRCLAIETKRDQAVLEQRICPDQQVKVSIDPTISEAAVNEIQTYTIRVWNEHTDRQVTDAVVRYQLPERMRYVGNSRNPDLHPVLERDDYTCALEQYFTVVCRLKAPLAPAPQDRGQSIDVTTIMLQLAATSAGAIQNSVEVSGVLSYTEVITNAEGVTTTQVITEPAAPAAAAASTTNMNTALRFDGVDDWVQLGYAPGKLTEFSVEMWIHPFSSDNGQSFIGAHTEDGQNVFLIGYWPEGDNANEGLLVNILGDDQVMLPEKRTYPHHLTVTVKGAPDKPQYDVTVYVYNPETKGLVKVGPRKFTAQIPTEGLKYRDWVLGQDWDQGSPAPRTSDFFKGAMREVRIWDQALDDAQEACVRSNRLYVNADGSLDLDCLQPDENSSHDRPPRLAGYWRLDAPVDAERTRVADLVPPQPNGSGSLHGAMLHGGIDWGGIDPRFGASLLFDGSNDYVVGAVVSDTISFTKSIDPAAVGAAVIEMLGVPAGQPVTTTDFITATPTVSATAPISAAAALSDIVTASISTWMYVADGIPTERQWIAGIVGPRTSAALMVDEDGRVAVLASCSGQLVLAKDAKTAPINRWVHYAGVAAINCDDIAQSVLSLYRDGTASQGQLEPLPAAAAPWAGCPANVYIGGIGPLQPAAGAGVESSPSCVIRWPFKGRIDEVRVWPRALSTTEIRRWRNRPGEYFDEIAYWPFAEGSGNRTNNVADDRYHLQIMGPKWIDTNFDLASQESGP